MITTKAVMDSSLEHATDVGPLAALSRFRRDFHACLTARADELCEPADAVLCADGPVRNLAGHTIATPRQAADGMHMLPGSTRGGRPTPVLHLHRTAYRCDGAANPTTPGGMTVIYKDLIASDQRTRQVIAALTKGRNCLVLINWTSHLQAMADSLHALGHEPVTLKGGMGVKDRAATLAGPRRLPPLWPDAPTTCGTPPCPSG
jgi:hypothetical protein